MKLGEVHLHTWVQIPPIDYLTARGASVAVRSSMVRKMGLAGMPCPEHPERNLFPPGSILPLICWSSDGLPLFRSQHYLLVPQCGVICHLFLLLDHLCLKLYYWLILLLCRVSPGWRFHCDPTESYRSVSFFCGASMILLNVVLYCFSFWWALMYTTVSPSSVVFFWSFSSTNCISGGAGFLWVGWGSCLNSSLGEVPPLAQGNFQFVTDGNYW